VGSIDEACEYLNKTRGNVLITTGSKELEPYKLVDGYQERLFFRFLPTIEALNECKRLQIKASNIICMQGPFSVNINKAMLEQINAEYLVTKETGQTGGFIEKLEAAKHQGVKVILIGRPLKEEGLDMDSACLMLRKMFGIKEKSCSHFPLFIDIINKKIVVVGGGNVATRRIETVLKFGAYVTVIAPQTSEKLNVLHEQGEISIVKREYRKSDLQNAYMVIIATDRSEINETAVKDARELKILLNTADKKEESDFFFPAVFSDEYIIGGLISNNGNNHKLAKEKAAVIRCFLEKGEQKG
jgi:precorrin-2 dehydrogenase/sirohydrochlorin ferrochelatase/precorrin-6A/cobalt-precorrin-6A reductase